MSVMVSYFEITYDSSLFLSIVHIFLISLGGGYNSMYNNPYQNYMNYGGNAGGILCYL